MLAESETAMLAKLIPAAERESKICTGSSSQKAVTRNEAGQDAEMLRCWTRKGGLHLMSRSGKISSVAESDRWT